MCGAALTNLCSLAEELKSLLRDSVDISVRAEGSGRVAVRPEMRNVGLTTVWAGLEALDLLEPVFEDWVSDMQVREEATNTIGECACRRTYSRGVSSR